MLGRIIVALAPVVVAGVRIVATDPAMRNFVMDLVSGQTPDMTPRRPPVRPHQNALAFSPCPACKGTGLVPVHEFAGQNPTISDERLRALLREMRAEGVDLEHPPH